MNTNSLSDNAKKSISIFENSEFGSVRTVELNGKIYFCGKDIATALGYKDTKKAIADHCPHALKHPLGVVTGKKSDGTDAIQIVSTSFIPEGDVYRLIASSKLPSAQKFESWIFDEVLPSIRKTGTYSVQQIAPTKTDRELNIEEAHILENLIPLCPVDKYKEILAAHISKKVTGEFLLPLPKKEKRTLTASEIAEELHVSKNYIGLIANKNGLKTPENGEIIWDRAYNGKMVENFVYYEHMTEVFSKYLEKAVGNAADKFIKSNK